VSGRDEHVQSHTTPYAPTSSPVVIGRDHEAVRGRSETAEPATSALDLGVADGLHAGEAEAATAKGPFVVTPW
jgi:hypothetical protein